MTLTVHDDQGVAVVAMAGELDEERTAELEEAFTQLLSEGRRQFVINLGQVGFIDSAGLSMLVRCFKRVRSDAGNLSLADLQPAVRHVLELTRLDRAFDIHADVATAVQRLASQ